MHRKRFNVTELQITALCLGGALLLPLTGCKVQSKKGANGSDDVNISTPLGGMSVKTDNAAVQEKIVSYCTQADAEYGRRLREALDRRLGRNKEVAEADAVDEAKKEALVGAEY